MATGSHRACANCRRASRLLDVGTGTGDIAYEARRAHPDTEVIGCDFTFEMMAVGQSKKEEGIVRRAGGDAAGGVEFVQGDGLRLPFSDGFFDAVTSGFLLRNVTDMDICLAEQRRVTKQGGRMVCLETSPPPQTVLAPLLRFYMLRIIPVLGQLVASSGGLFMQPTHSGSPVSKCAGMRSKNGRIGLSISTAEHRRFRAAGRDGAADGTGRFSACFLPAQNVGNCRHPCGDRMSAASLRSGNPVGRVGR